MMVFVIHPISDLCARLKNACLAGLRNTKVAYSGVVMKVLQTLKEEGYIVDYTYSDDDKYLIDVRLKYDNRGIPVIRYITPISKPSKRVYSSFRDFKLKEQFATLIVSTSSGVLAHNDAKKKGIGGEILLEVAS